MSTIELEDGKYEVTNTNGVLTFKRYGESWDPNLAGSGVVLAMVQKIEQLLEENKQFRESIEQEAMEQVNYELTVKGEDCPDIWDLRIGGITVRVDCDQELGQPTSAKILVDNK